VSPGKKSFSEKKIFSYFSREKFSLRKGCFETEEAEAAASKGHH
jgi:hypothetical protein